MSIVSKNGIVMDGISEDIQNIINNAINKEEPSKEEKIPIKPKILGKYKTKMVFHEFIGTIGNINILSKVANIKGKYFDSELKNDFKMELLDDNTFNFEEIIIGEGTKICSEIDIKRYISTFEDYSLIGYRNRSVISNLKFVVTDRVNDKELQVTAYLVVNQHGPFNDLLDIFKDDDNIPETSAKDLQEKLSSLFDDEDDSEIKIEPPTPVLEAKKELNKTNSFIAEEFIEIKKEKKEKLSKQLKNIAHQRDICKNNILSIEQKINEFNSEIKLLTSRIDSLDENEPFNGYFIYIPPVISESSIIPDDLKTMIGKFNAMNYANTTWFMKIFENSLYQIRIGLEVEGKLTELTAFKDVYTIFHSLILSDNEKIYIKDDKLFYEGKLQWSDLNNKLIKLGFNNNNKFDEFCNTNTSELIKNE